MAHRRCWIFRVGGIIGDSSGLPVDWVFGRRTASPGGREYRSVVALDSIIGAQAKPGQAFASDSGYTIVLSGRQCVELLRTRGRPVTWNDDKSPVRLGIAINRADDELYLDRQFILSPPGSTSASAGDFVWVGDERIEIDTDNGGWWDVVRARADSRAEYQYWTTGDPEEVATPPIVWHDRPRNAVGLWAYLYQADEDLTNLSLAWSGPITGITPGPSGDVQIEVGSAISVLRSWPIRHPAVGVIPARPYNGAIRPTVSATVAISQAGVSLTDSYDYARIYKGDRWAIVRVDSVVAGEVTFTTQPVSSSTSGTFDVMPVLAVGEGASPMEVPDVTVFLDTLSTRVSTGSGTRAGFAFELINALEVPVIDAMVLYLASQWPLGPAVSMDVADQNQPAGAVLRSAPAVGQCIAPVWMAQTMGDLLERYILGPCGLSIVPSATMDLTLTSWGGGFLWWDLPVSAQLDPRAWQAGEIISPIGGATWESDEDGTIRVLPEVAYPQAAAPREVDTSLLAPGDASLIARWAWLVSTFARAIPTYRITAVPELATTQQGSLAGSVAPVSPGDLVVLENPGIPGEDGVLGIVEQLAICIERSEDLITRAQTLTVALLDGIDGARRAQWAAEAVVQAFSSVGTIHTITLASPSTGRLWTIGDEVELCDSTGALVDVGEVTAVTQTTLTIDCATSPVIGYVVLLDNFAATGYAGNAWIADAGGELDGGDGYAYG